MTALLDITGQRYGRLLVVRRAPNADDGSVCWECLCDCGNTHVATGHNIRGNTKSCGCLRREITSANKLTHGGRRTDPVWHVWQGMKQRCLNPKSQDYKCYGGRGITVCDRWKKSFAAFRDDMGPRPAGYTVERKNNDGNYEPGNCKWADRKEQAQNTRPRKRSAA